MRWLALWLLLTGAQLAGWALSRWAAGGGWAPAGEDLVHFALVPPVQLAALWVVAVVRRSRLRRSE